MGSGFAGHSSYVESTVSGCSGADNRVHDSSAHLVRWNSCSQVSAVMPDLCQARRSLPTSRLTQRFRKVGTTIDGKTFRYLAFGVTPFPGHFCKFKKVLDRGLF